MRLYTPRSTLRLILYGFLAVSLPLFLALVYAAINFDRLTLKSQSAVYQGVLAIQTSQTLSQQLVMMERAARQYLILKDDSLLESYQDTHEQFQKAAALLNDLPLASARKSELARLIDAENQFYTEFSTQGSEPLGIVQTFANLAALMDTVLIGSNELIERDVRKLKVISSKTRRRLLSFAVALFPLTALSVLVFTILISRPIRQLARAIQALGDGDLDNSIYVSGPQDLRHLGQQLDWLRQRLVELESQKTRFLRHISHELKTPLTAIREVGELLIDEVVGTLSDQQSEIVRILHANTLRLNRLIEDLLNFSIAHFQTLKLKLNKIDAKPVVVDAVEYQKPVIIAKNLTLKMELNSIMLMADKDKLYTIVDNLLSNAIKFSPAASTISISLYQSTEQLIFDIIDEGPGIPATEHEKVFEAFYQGQLQTDNYVQGSGLGLSIAQEYAAAHNGSLSIKEKIGRGTHIQMVLPLNIRLKPEL